MDFHESMKFAFTNIINELQPYFPSLIKKYSKKEINKDANNLISYIFISTTFFYFFYCLSLNLDLKVVSFFPIMDILVIWLFLIPYSHHILYKVDHKRVTLVIILLICILKFICANFMALLVLNEFKNNYEEQRTKYMIINYFIPIYVIGIYFLIFLQFFSLKVEEYHLQSIPTEINNEPGQ